MNDDNGLKQLQNRKFLKLTTVSSHKILSSSVAWFGLGFAIVFLLGYGFTKVPFLERIFIDIISTPYAFLLLSIVAIGLMLAISFGVRRMSLEVLTVLYVAFCLIESFYMAVIFAVYAQNYSKLLLVFGIPCATFAIMGFLGYYQVIDFGKLAHVLFISMIGLLIFGLVTFFVQNSWLITLYCILGYALFSLYVGYDLWRISKLDEIYSNGAELDKTEIRKYGLMFGMMLLIDFIQLVWLLASLLKN